MLLCGILIGPHALNLISAELLMFSEEIRLFTLLLILFKAGLGLDREKITAEGSVAVRLAFIPALVEAGIVAVAARLLLGWGWLVC